MSILETPTLKHSSHFNATYQGQVKDGKRNGTGIFEYETGDIYLGEWENDSFNG